MALEAVRAEIGLRETRGKRLVCLARMSPQLARPLMQHIAPLLGDFPAAAPLFEGGGFGGVRRLAELEGLAVSCHGFSEASVRRRNSAMRSSNSKGPHRPRTLEPSFHSIT